MAGIDPVAIYVRQPVPPYQRIAGPIPHEASERSYIMSEREDARVAVAVGDIDIEWTRPGMCWSIESPNEAIWAGFVRPQEIDLDASAITLDLVAPLEGLLNVEMAIRDPVRQSVAAAVRVALIEAQAASAVGMFAGDIQSEAKVIDTEIRGETVAEFIESVRSDTGLDWRTRAEPIQGNGIEFLLDFGNLQKRTDIVIERNDLVAGKIIRGPAVSSITVMGSAITFEERPAATAAASTRRLSGQSGREITTEGAVREFVEGRDIGPASARHQTVIVERVRASIGQVADSRIIDTLRSTDELFVTLDMSNTALRALRIGDVCRINVPLWVTGLSVVGDAQVREIVPSEETGERDLVLWPLAFKLADTAAAIEAAN